MTDDGTQNAILEIAGMTCEDCAHHDLVARVGEDEASRTCDAPFSLAEAAVARSAVLATGHEVTTGELAATFHAPLSMADRMKRVAKTFATHLSKFSCCGS